MSPSPVAPLQPARAARRRLLTASVLLAACGIAPVLAAVPARVPARQKIRVYSAERREYIVTDKVIRSDEEWKKRLTADQYRITRHGGTELAFTGALWNAHDPGVYQCVCCGNDLFQSEHKFESGTGWPSFWKPIAPQNVLTHRDRTLGMERTEVRCARCDAHLGHVFDDGPKPTGLRYCMNSGAMVLKKRAAKPPTP